MSLISSSVFSKYSNQYSYLFQHDRTKGFWVDGSPYAFQMWKQSAGSTMKMTTFVEYYYERKWHQTPYMVRRKKCVQCLDYIEPHTDPTVNCTAVKITAEGINRWIKIPCTEKDPDSSFVCEIHKAKHQPTSSQQSTARVRTWRSYVECPPRTIRLAYTCIRVYTSVWRYPRRITNICAAHKASLGLYHIPRFVALDDPLSYGEREVFILDFLQAMNHRWPGLADHESALADELLMADVNSTEPVVFRFSMITISHVAVDSELSEKGGTGAVHVVCEFPFSSVSSDCFSGHFSCYDGTCILAHYVCDGVADCPDGTDEVDCDHVCIFADGYDANERKNCFISCFPTNCTCNDLYFHCSLGGCVPWSRVCDGVNNCPNNEDEHICEFYYLSSSTMIHIYTKE